MMRGHRAFHNLTGPVFGRSIPRANLLVYPHLEEFADEMDTLLSDGGIGVLTGDMGIGKTTALRHYIGGLEERSVQVCYQGSSRHAVGVLEELVDCLGVAPVRGRSALLRQIGQRVRRTFHEQRRRTLIVLDDAQMLDDGLLEDMRLLTNFGMDAEDALVLLLVGHPSLRPRLQKPVHMALHDRVRMHYQMEGLSRDETFEYIDRHMQAAGGRGDVFTPDAKTIIFEHAQGIPRRINDVSLTCLKKSASRKVSPIDADFVSTVLTLMQRT